MVTRAVPRSNGYDLNTTQASRQPRFQAELFSSCREAAFLMREDLFFFFYRRHLLDVNKGARRKSNSASKLSFTRLAGRLLFDEGKIFSSSSTEVINLM